MWSEWGEWEECSVTCGGDIHSRKRECIPDGDCPDDTGFCVGNDMQSQACGVECCPREKVLVNVYIYIGLIICTNECTI